MRIEQIDLHYQLRFHSAFHFGTGLRSGLVHRGIARNSDGFLYVPGSSVKGMLRNQATHLAHLLEIKAREPHHNSDVSEFSPKADITTMIFGSRVRPGTLFFDDAQVCPEDQEFFQPKRHDHQFMLSQTETRIQVSLSRLTSTARRGLLFSSEYGVPDIRFNGRIYGYLPGVPLDIDDTKTYSLILLLSALCSLDRLGRNNSAGAGCTTCVITRLRVNGTTIVDISPEQHDSISEGIRAYLDLLPEFEYYQIAEEEDQ